MLENLNAEQIRTLIKSLGFGFGMVTSSTCSEKIGVVSGTLAGETAKVLWAVTATNVITSVAVITSATAKIAYLQGFLAIATTGVAPASLSLMGIGMSLSSVAVGAAPIVTPLVVGFVANRVVGFTVGKVGNLIEDKLRYFI